MKQQLIVLLLAVTGIPAWAQQDIYVCVDAQGRREYRNTGPQAHCKRADLPDVSIVSSTSGSRSSVLPEKTVAVPALPSVNASKQKARDEERKRILQDELQVEQSKLTELQREYNDGEPERLGGERNYAKYLERTARLKDELARTERNIEALKRELKMLK